MIPVDERYKGGFVALDQPPYERQIIGRCTSGRTVGVVPLGVDVHGPSRYALLTDRRRLTTARSMR